MTVYVVSIANVDSVSFVEKTFILISFLYQYSHTELVKKF